MGGEPSAIRDSVQAAEDLGYHHILVYEHLLAFAESPNPSYYGLITPELTMHEPLLFLGFLAALTRRVELFTGALVLPIRQTIAVAKQAAEIDALSGGRLRLGWAWATWSASSKGSNEDYHTRGRRMEEQIEVLRALWTRDALTYEGRWHRLVDGARLLGVRVQKVGRDDCSR